MVRETRPFDEVCLLPKPRSIVFPEPRSNSDYKLLCNKLKGSEWTNPYFWESNHDYPC